MKKEKQVRSYKRRTKSGKTVTVKAHTAKYEAADEKAKEVSKKPGAGKELEERKKKPVQLEIPFGKEEEKKVLDEVKETTKKESSKKPAEKKTTKKVRPVGSGTNGPTPKRKSEAKVTKTTSSKPATSEPAFTAAEFKEWYRGTGSATDKKVAKALRAQLGRSGYRKLEDEAIDNYSSRGHLSMFKRVSGGSSATETKAVPKSRSVKTPVKKTAGSSDKVSSKATTDGSYSKITNKALQKKITAYVQEATNWEHSAGAKDYTWSDTLRALSDPGEKTVRYRVDKMIADSKKTSKKTTAPTTSKRIKMSDRVREKKRKTEERLRKVKESGMSLDEYNRLH